jgi:hypothetical protein
VLYDDIVVGSGMAALGVLLGLPAQRKVLILAGPSTGRYSYYGNLGGVPCSYLGLGGLGNDWHGVVPMGLHENFGHSSRREFSASFNEFYPRTALADRLGDAQLFVPWRPIRPAREIQRLLERRKDTATLTLATVSRFARDPPGTRVHTVEGGEYICRRLWVGAGALHTPRLLEASLGPGFSRPWVSDHAVCYVGKLDGHPAPQISRTADGLFFQAFYDSSHRFLYTLRPARFAFRRLDYGFEQRAVFGMPTGSIFAKILKRMSPGLLAEALYNRAGVFPKARSYSVYAQCVAGDSYAMEAGERPIRVRLEQIRRATDQARSAVPFAGLQPSARPELYIPGIHLHNSVDNRVLAAADINQAHSTVQIVDSSPVEHIGPDHQSFKVLVHARQRASILST